MIKTKKSSIVKFIAPDDTEHDSQEEAEIHHLTAQLKLALPNITPSQINEVATALIGDKSTFGPLLHVPKKRVVKTPEEKAAAKKAAADLAAKKKADAKAAKDAAKSKTT